MLNIPDSDEEDMTVVYEDRVFEPDEIIRHLRWEKCDCISNVRLVIDGEEFYRDLNKVTSMLEQARGTENTTITKTYSVAEEENSEVYSRSQIRVEMGGEPLIEFEYFS